MNTTEVGRDNRFGLLLLTALVIVATLVSSFAITQPPRSFGVWLTVLFICWVEAVFGGMILWRQRNTAVSGAMSAIIFTAAAIYAAAGIASVNSFVASRDRRGDEDHIILGILLVETISFFLILLILIRKDKEAISAATETARTTTNRVEISNRIANTISTLKGCGTTDAEEQRRIEVLVKRLYAAQCALQHSHLPEAVASADVEISSITDKITAETAQIRPDVPISGVVGAIEPVIRNLERLLRENGIS